MLNRSHDRLDGVRAEIVTTTFVASGTPEGIHDLGRLLESLNNPAIFRQLQLNDPAVRPLYRATASLELDAPLLVRREDVIFVTFDGPYFTRGLWKPATIEVPALLMAPPFQMQGSVAVAQEADITESLRTMSQRFFLIRDARVFDADGALLGEGDQIIVNGATVQMMSATRRHISAVTLVPNRRGQESEAAAGPDAPAERRSHAA